MSRSYKKYPTAYLYCGFPQSFLKRFAARRVRNYKYFSEVSNGGWYKKLFNSDEIFESKWIFYSDKELRKFISKKIKNSKIISGYETHQGLHYINRLKNDNKIWFHLYYGWYKNK